jgi:hypothetical protein
MNRLFKPFPQPIALSRLKSNAFLLILTTLIRSLFTPYTSLRRAVIRLFSTRWPEHIIWGNGAFTLLVLWV